MKNHILQNISTASAKKISSMAQSIISDKIAIQELLDILLLDPPISTRFSWLLGDLSTKNAKYAPLGRYAPLCSCQSRTFVRIAKVRDKVEQSPLS